MTINQASHNQHYTIVPIYTITPGRGTTGCSLCNIEFEYPVLDIYDFLRKKRILCPIDLFHLAHAHPQELLKSKTSLICNGQARPLDQLLIDEIRQYQHDPKIKTEANS